MDETIEAFKISHMNCLHHNLLLNVDQFLYSHFQMKPGIYDCEICGNRYKTAYSWKKHTDAHKGIFKKTCHLCQKGFRDGYSLQQHLASHSEIREFKCKICERDYRYKRDYVCHMRKKHEQTIY